jgi:hypothetical protein
MLDDIKLIAKNWTLSDSGQIDFDAEMYCETRDIFQARLDKMLDFLLSNGIEEQLSFYIYSMAGEIGNNSFDHNVGKWRDLPGIFFGFETSAKNNIVLADRGQGILHSLKRVKPELENDLDALHTAFTEKISGRAPENRGNGLKYVKENIFNNNMHLDFYSGNGLIELNQEIKLSKNDQNYQGCLAILTF